MTDFKVGAVRDGKHNPDTNLFPACRVDCLNGSTNLIHVVVLLESVLRLPNEKNLPAPDQWIQL